MIYLKANTEQEFTDALYALGWKWDAEEVDGEVTREAGYIYDNGTYCLDIVGTITVQTGTEEHSELGTIATLEELEGYHANLLLRNGMTIPQELQSFVIPTPTNPRRRFA
jgi:hypothetical protein